jgi:hypothetical protein
MESASRISAIREHTTCHAPSIGTRRSSGRKPGNDAQYAGKCQLPDERLRPTVTKRTTTEFACYEARTTDLSRCRMVGPNRLRSRGGGAMRITSSRRRGGVRERRGPYGRGPCTSPRSARSHQSATRAWWRSVGGSSSMRATAGCCWRSVISRGGCSRACSGKSLR